MKPLPLLCTLCVATAILGVLLLTTRKGGQGERELSPIPAPLPPSFAMEEDDLLAIPPAPLLQGDLTPADELIAFAEEFVGWDFAKAPVFQVVTLDELVSFVSDEIAPGFDKGRQRELEILAGALGVAPDFQPLAQSLITVVAGEVRGVVAGSRNLILEDFNPEAPPEQVALVHLLVERLLLEKSPAPSFETASIDQILAHQLFVQTFALLAEQSFRESLPDYPPSLHENIREAILVGLPDFIYELTAFSEFHLATRLSQPTPRTALEEILRQHETGMSLSRLLLAYPEEDSAPMTQNPYQLGPLALSLLTLKSGDVAKTQELSRNLLLDQLETKGDEIVWTLSFASVANANTAADLLESSLPFRYSEQSVKILREAKTVQIICSKGHE